nr:MAG TPA: hypothetical protein [Caudoviricetes sp.]DAY00929.1 MAG TPA: hypothetical protein [Caudoviricetes sp.]
MSLAAGLHWAGRIQNCFHGQFLLSPYRDKIIIAL